MSTSDFALQMRETKEPGFRFTEFIGYDDDGNPAYRPVKDVSRATGITIYRNSVPKKNWDQIVAKAKARLVDEQGFSVSKHDPSIRDGLIRFVRKSFVTQDDFWAQIKAKPVAHQPDAEDDDLPF